MHRPTLVFFLVAAAGAVYAGESSLPGRLKVDVTDHATGEHIPAAVRITNLDGRVMRADRMDGDLWTAGRLFIVLPPGRYILQVARDRSWCGFRGPIEIRAGQTLRLPVRLARPRITDLNRRGFVSCLLGARVGEGGRWIGAPSGERLALAAACRGVDTAAFTDRAPRAPAPGRARLLAATAFGELPHGRVLVLWPGEAQPAAGSSNAARMAAARARGALCVYVHPGTEPAGALPFDTLAGPAYDAVALASPEDERVWFNLLSQGYRVPAVGLTESDLSAGDPLAPGTFVRLRGEPSPEKLLAGMREGHAMVSQGPFVFLRLGDRRPGDRLDVPAGRLRGFVEAFASIQEGEYIASLDLILNGKVVKHLKGGPHVLRMEDSVDLPAEPGWILARCETVPIPVKRTTSAVAVAGGKESAKRTIVRRAWTNPIWIESRERAVPPAPLEAKVSLRILDRRTGRSVPGTLEVFVPGRKSVRHEAPGGRCEFSLPLTGRVRVTAPGYRAYEADAYSLTGAAARALTLAKEEDPGKELARRSTFSALAFALARVKQEIRLEKEGVPTRNENVDSPVSTE